MIKNSVAIFMQQCCNIISDYIKHNKMM